MPSITLPNRISVSLGKRKERSQMALTFTIDGRIRVMELPVQNNCADLDFPDGSGKGFLIDADNQFESEEDGTWYQLLDEKDQIPICLRKVHELKDGNNDEIELKQVSDDIYKIAYRQKLMEGLSKAKTANKMDKMVLIVSIVFGSLLIFAGMNYLWG